METNTLVGNGNIVRGEAGFVKSPTEATDCPLTNNLLTAIGVLANGGHTVSLQTGNPGAGVRTSPTFATGLPLMKVLETTGVTVLTGYTQQGLNETLSGFPSPATGLIKPPRYYLNQFLTYMARTELYSFFFDNYGTLY